MKIFTVFVALMFAALVCEPKINPETLPQPGQPVTIDPEDTLTGFGLINYRCSKEYLNPIRPGYEGRNPYWNIYSKKFIYAPAFDFNAVSGAHHYVFSATNGKKEWAFTSDKVACSLAPIWNQITPGQVTLTVNAYDAGGRLISKAGERTFVRDYPFEGPYPKAVAKYSDSVLKGLRYIHGRKDMVYWRTHAEPDTLSYNYYAYANKIVSAACRLEIELAKMDPSLKDECIVSAKNAADFLISQSRPKGDPLEYFTPSYYGRQKDAGLPENINTVMTRDPVYAAEAFMDLYDLTKEQKYLDHAANIARTYVKIQQSDGKMYIKLHFLTGEPVNTAGAMLDPMLRLFNRLRVQYGMNEFEAAERKGRAWMKTVALETFEFVGQFEDVSVNQKHYQNLTNVTAAMYADYILGLAVAGETLTDAEIADMRDVIDFAEDQFVHWKSDDSSEMAPLVHEQYRYEKQVDNSAANVANAYMSAYQVTKEPIYYYKAQALLDTITRTQMSDGKMPTTYGSSSYWINCSLASMLCMLRFEQLESPNL